MIAINEGFCFLKMTKCRRRQATDPQKLKKIVNGRFFVFCWWKRKRLKNNRFHIPAYKADANIEKVQLVYSDLRLTIGIVADELEIAKETVRTILVENLGMQKVCAKIVPRLLTSEQKVVV